MAPPKYSDLGKSAKDLFTKQYTHGFLKLDVNTKTGPTVEFKTKAEHNLASQKVKANLEVKYKVPEHGLTITEKWNTDNSLGTILEINDQIAKGLKVILDTNYTPHNAKRGAELKTEYTADNFKTQANITLLGGPVLDLAGVVKVRENWLVGGQAKFDLQTNEVKTVSLALGRQTDEYTLHSFTVDGREFGASVFHKVHKNFEYGVQLGWKTGDQGTQWGFASKYQATQDLALRAKVDNKAQVALAATHSLSDAAKLTVASQFGLAGLPEANNKFGILLEYSP